MNWQDSVMKPKEITFNLTAKRNKKGIDLIIPLQQLVELQAKRSFAAGAATALDFIGQAIKSGTKIDTELLKTQMEAWGLTEIWEKIQGREKND